MTASNDIPTAPLSVAEVTLTVRELATVSAFYQRAIGLHALSTDATEHVLGAGDHPLLRLRADARARLGDPRAAGLFHTAFLMPGRAYLASWLQYTLAQHHVRLDGASDHGVSEALYLHDPEGNGIEVYADRPREQWRREGDRVEMVTEPLDVDNLLGEARSPWRGLPIGARIGHVHLQVGDTATAESFYAHRLGLAITHRRPGATFFASGGYHHHIAANVWNSAGALPRDPNTTGLAAMTLATTRGELLTPANARTLAHDPWGIGIYLTGPDAGTTESHMVKSLSVLSAE